MSHGSAHVSSSLGTMRKLPNNAPPTHAHREARTPVRQVCAEIFDSCPGDRRCVCSRSCISRQSFSSACTHIALSTRATTRATCSVRPRSTYNRLDQPVGLLSRRPASHVPRPRLASGQPSVGRSDGAYSSCRNSRGHPWQTPVTDRSFEKRVTPGVGSISSPPE